MRIGYFKFKDVSAFTMRPVFSITVGILQYQKRFEIHWFNEASFGFGLDFKLNSVLVQLGNLSLTFRIRTPHKYTLQDAEIMIHNTRLRGEKVNV